MPNRSKPKSPNSAARTKSLTFHVEIPAKILKIAILALADKEFNPNYSAMIQVTEHGLEITVQRIIQPTEDRHYQFSNQTVYGIIRFKATGLDCFECITPLRKTVFLYPLPEILADIADADVVSVYHLSNTPNKLYFKFGSAPNNHPIQLMLHDQCLGLPKCQNLSYKYETVIPSNKLVMMAERILKLAPEQRPYTVIVKKATETGMEAGSFELKLVAVNHQFEFTWRYWAMLMKALRSAENCDIFLVTDLMVPGDSVKSVKVRFDFGYMGELFFLQGQIVLFHD